MAEFNLADFCQNFFPSLKVIRHVPSYHPMQLKRKTYEPGLRKKAKNKLILDPILAFYLFIDIALSRYSEK